MGDVILTVVGAVAERDEGSGAERESTGCDDGGYVRQVLDSRERRREGARYCWWLLLSSRHFFLCL